MMGKNKLAILGANESITMLIDKAKQLGYETHVFAWQCGDPGEKAADHFYPISVSDKEAILEQCRKIGICGICSITSDFAAPVAAWVARNLGLPGNPERTDIVARNKYQMRKAFKEYGGIYCPAFAKTGPEFDETIVRSFHFPVIVKPTDRWGSKGITRVDKMEDLRAAVLYAVRESYEKKAIIEEFMEGPEYSAECIVYHGEPEILQFTRKMTTGSPHYIETGHIQPSDIPAGKQDLIKETVKRGVRALGITDSAAHAEFRILVNGEVGFMEIGARMGGGCIGTDLTPMTTGKDYIKMVIDVACGNRPCMDIVTEPEPAEVRFIIDQRDVEEFHSVDPKRIIRRSAFDPDCDKEVVDGSTRHGYYIIKRERE